MSRLILILGMHRSGTSAVAKSMECLGASLGPHAEWYGPDNPKGFWEDQDVWAFNEQVLTLLGRSWHDPQPITYLADWLAQSNAVEISTRILKDRLSGTPIFALKEPRLCRLLPMWRLAALKAGADVSVVHVVRHPLAVAASLTKRDGMSTKRGVALWLEYTRRARLDADPLWPTVTVDCSQFMTGPLSQLRRIAGALDLELELHATIRFLSRHIDAELWHHRDAGGILPDDVAAEWALAKERAA